MVKLLFFNNKKTLKNIIIIIIIISIITFSADAKKNNKTKYQTKKFNNNNLSIQEKINAAEPGDTIFVKNGTYYENIVINKPINLIGENKKNTIIDGKNLSDTITIESENVKIMNFTIKNGTGNGVNNIFRAGIRILKSNNTIKQNIIKDNNVGLFTRRIKNTTIEDNQFINNSILLSPYDVVEIDIDFKIDYFIQNIKNNSVNGKDIVYLINEKNKKISYETGQIIAVNCNNISIDNLSFSKCDYSLLLISCKKCIIKNSDFINDADIWLLNCQNNLFENNLMKKNFHGITLDYSSKNNKFISNNFSNNTYMGVMIEKQSNYNIFKKNNFMNNLRGAYIVKSFKNKWINNYWQKRIIKNDFLKKFLPKIIFGSLTTKQHKIPTLINFDLKPAKTPYII